MSELDRVEIQNLRQRVRELTAESKRHAASARRWKNRAEKAEWVLGLVDARVQYLEQTFLPEQVTQNGWVQ